MYLPHTPPSPRSCTCPAPPGRVPAPHPPLPQVVNLQVYTKFIEAVDAEDNGVNPWEGSGTPRYENTTTLGKRVSYLNPE